MCCCGGGGGGGVGGQHFFVLRRASLFVGSAFHTPIPTHPPHSHSHSQPVRPSVMSYAGVLNAGAEVDKVRRG